jgi:hypothetical protein
VGFGAHRFLVRACFCRIRANGTTEKNVVMGGNGRENAGSPFRQRCSDRLRRSESRFARERRGAGVLTFERCSYGSTFIFFTILAGQTCKCRLGASI